MGCRQDIFGRKICVLKDMCRWLKEHNHTLKGAFDQEENCLAWNIASFVDGGGEVEEYGEF